MISISHWGMFEEPNHPSVVQEGFRLDDSYLSHMTKPSGVIQMNRVNPGDVQPIYQRLNFGKLD